MMTEYDLTRYLDAQAKDFATALKEIKEGYKQSHWMWFIFPQIIGLGQSRTSILYSIQSLDEAKAYMNNETLANNMNTICEALVALKTNDANGIFGYPDDVKLQSSMTLFGEACPENEIFAKVLDKFFEGKKDTRTLELIGWKTYIDSIE